MKKLIFWIEVKFDNFKAKKRIKQMQKEYSSLCWELFIRKHEDSEETRMMSERAILLRKQIEVEKLFMLEV